MGVLSGMQHQIDIGFRHAREQRIGHMEIRRCDLGNNFTEIPADDEAVEREQLPLWAPEQEPAHGTGVVQHAGFHGRFRWSRQVHSLSRVTRAPHGADSFNPAGAGLNEKYPTITMSGQPRIVSSMALSCAPSPERWSTGNFTSISTNDNDSPPDDGLDNGNSRRDPPRPFQL